MITHGWKYRQVAGFTIIELVLVIGMLGMVLAIVYPAFDNVSKRTRDLNEKLELTQKSQRVLDYITEELRLAGLYVGWRPSITHCGEAGINSLVNTPGNPYDTVSFLTAEQITTEVANIPFLASSGTSTPGSTLVPVNAAGTTNVPHLWPSTTTATNARAFITFDSLKPNLGNMVYQVTASTSGAPNMLAITPALDQLLNQGSNAYFVIRKQFSVDMVHPNDLRSLDLNKWDKNCADDTYPLLASHADMNAEMGGVDGLQFEYILETGQTVATLSAPDIEHVRAVRVWLLVRTDFPDPNYTDTQTYILGSPATIVSTVNPALSPAVTVTPAGAAQNYRRVLLSQTVEVKNVGL